MSRGNGLPKRRHRYSIRFRDMANSDLNNRCSSRLSRRMSMMNATRGRTAAMYEKFWSGPTPMYAPPETPVRFNVPTTGRYESSLEMRLSVSKKPGGSESLDDRLAHAESASAVGGVA